MYTWSDKYFNIPDFLSFAALSFPHILSSIWILQEQKLNSSKKFKEKFKNQGRFFIRFKKERKNQKGLKSYWLSRSSTFISWIKDFVWFICIKPIQTVV